jgi:hypothetical protein
VVSTVLAVGAGLLMGRHAWLHALFEPLLELLRPLPKPALLPPLILFLGLGDAMKLTVIGLGVFFPTLINTLQGVRGVDPVQLDVARTFGHSPRALLLKVVLPAAMPLVLSGMRISLGLDPRARRARPAAQPSVRAPGAARHPLVPARPGLTRATFLPPVTHPRRSRCVQPLSLDWRAWLPWPASRSAWAPPPRLPSPSSCA